MKTSNNHRPKAVLSGREIDLMRVDSAEPQLSRGNYALSFNPQRGYYLVKQLEGFQFPPKIYGSPETFAQRVVTSYHKRGRGMGVLLSGDKGGGKTLAARMIADLSGLPVILFQSGYAGQGLANFLDNLPNPCALFLDEFEKIYPKGDDRNFFLTLMDGTATSRHLFILTSNTHDIGAYFSNRPGRIRYHQTYIGMDEALIRGVVEDSMPEGKAKEQVLSLALALPDLNLDALTAMIEECLLFGEEPRDFLRFFNVDTSPASTFDCVWETKTANVDTHFIRSLGPDRQAEIREYRNDLLHYPEEAHGWHPEIHELVKDHIQLESLTLTRDYVKDPVTFNESGKPIGVVIGGMRETGVSYARARELDLRWGPREIGRTVREGRILTIHHNNGVDRLVLTPYVRSQSKWMGEA